VQQRFAVLTPERLEFSKIKAKGENLDKSSHTCEVAVKFTLSELERTFKEHDQNDKGNLGLEEAMTCLQALNLYRTREEGVELFNELDMDRSGMLDWEEFVVLAKHAATTCVVVDHIPLEEVEGIEYSLVPKEDLHAPDWVTASAHPNSSFRNKPRGLGEDEDEDESCDVGVWWIQCAGTLKRMVMSFAYGRDVHTGGQDEVCVN
jgi:hypothetical protein